jgi:NTP pyrophosphatase (non-canonical NTP hydrolase)
LYLVRSEVGELAESLLHVRWAEQSGDADRIERARAETAAELYDVVWNICDLANVLGIDPDDAARRQKQFNRDRVWEVAEPGQERGA